MTKSKKSGILEIGGLPTYVKNNVSIMVTNEYPSDGRLQELFCELQRQKLFPHQEGRYLVRICDEGKITIVLVTPDDESLVPSSEFIDRMAENLRGE
jgi:hypothetical protein